MATYSARVVQVRTDLWHAYPAGQPNLIATGATRQAALDALIVYLRAQESAPSPVACTTEEPVTVET